MRELFRSYIISLVNDIPHDVYLMAMAVFCVGMMILIGQKGFRRGLRYSATLLLVEYIFLVYSSTVFFRDVQSEHKYIITPLWSYKAIKEGQKHLMPENIMNVVAFVPVGLLLRTQISWTTPKKGWIFAFLVGLSLSVGIESLQFIFKKGFSEVDDVIHNTFGCLLGYLLSIIIIKIYQIYKS